VEGWKPKSRLPIFQPSSMGSCVIGFHPSTLPSTLQILYIFYINSLET
jgi:hypothetical protein